MAVNFFDNIEDKSEFSPKKFNFSIEQKILKITSCTQFQDDISQRAAAASRQRFFFSALRLFSKLPLYVRNCETLKKFKTGLKPTTILQRVRPQIGVDVTLRANQKLRNAWGRQGWRERF